ncbi:ABC transporter ATP-binding protein [uncultured Dialister sp.]|uniref:ABC transporter ATP-binding protein n=1 Tax=uncultured Dialister sp. TaxID=278064 RepID=UPI002629919A|nr:ABC transporter ATP-binding protein [uncultured Dialister sp.]
MEKRTDKVSWYFLKEKKILSAAAVSGLLYNLGLVLTPWFEGQLSQCIADILEGIRLPMDLVLLALAYLATVLFVQAMRYVKRLSVRRFANNTTLSMKETIYTKLLDESRQHLQEEGAGGLMTRVISDVDACAEGMRKFTTEIFDTGIAMAAYSALLFYYDWRLTILVLLFPPAAYYLADRLKKPVTTASRKSRESAGRLASGTMDRLQNAMTYRLFGEEKAQNRRYSRLLEDYQKKRISSGLWENTMEPIYQVIAMTGSLLILWLGGKNVLGEGWETWNIAAFAAYLACFTRLAVKASHAAHLFNALQKAEVSWQRIHPYLSPEKKKEIPIATPALLSVHQVSFTYPGAARPTIQNLSFHARPGEIIGITGETASGKSTLGRLFLMESAHKGSITWGGKELGKDISPSSLIGYMGHEPELFSATVEDNIRLGQEGNLEKAVEAADLKQDLSTFPQGIQTPVGEGGIRLSGGQKSRILLARLLYHRRPLLILDDPFASLDYATEDHIFRALRSMKGTTLLISHRLRHFPATDQVLWIGQDGKVTTSTHEGLMKENAEYRKLWEMQCRGGS